MIGLGDGIDVVVHTEVGVRLIGVGGVSHVREGFSVDDDLEVGQSDDDQVEVPFASLPIPSPENYYALRQYGDPPCLLDDLLRLTVPFIHMR